MPRIYIDGKPYEAAPNQTVMEVEETLRQTGASQLDANEIGLAILGPLRELDEVAYLRFASVYQAFDSLEDFEAAISQLRVDHARPRR